MTLFCCKKSANLKLDLEIGSDSNIKGKQSCDSELEYGVEDVPPLPLCFLFGLQQLLLSISSTISVPLVVCLQICAGDLDLVKSQIMSTFLFMCGICTILQCTLGVRLPILQGGCHKFLPAVAALMSLETWKCPDMGPSLEANSTLDAGQVWKPRMREIQGGIIVASVIQMLIGCTGLLGALLQWIGPITIVHTISLVGLSLIHVALRFCQAHWGISSLTVGLLLFFSLYLRNLVVPLPGYSKKVGCRVLHYPLFQLIPVILAVVISWFLCVLLTELGVAPASLRTDAKSSVIDAADWFFWPYPGVPDLDRVLGVLCGTSMFVGGVLAFVLDNTVPGTVEDRGIEKWRCKLETPSSASGSEDSDTRQKKDQDGNNDQYRTLPVDVVNLSVVSGPVRFPAVLELSSKVAENNQKLVTAEKLTNKSPAGSSLSIYDLPVVTPYLARIKCFRYWPVLSGFSYNSINCRRARC